MSDRIKLEVVTPEGQVFSGNVESIVAPTVSGSVGILYNHAPLMGALKLGILKYVCEGKKQKIAIGPGFIEVKSNHVMVLVKFGEQSQNIDKERALHAKERAETRLANINETIDVVRAKAALQRALNRLSAVEEENILRGGS